MTSAQHCLIVATCNHAAAVWAEGDPERALRWFAAAVAELGDDVFIDADEDATR
jgi:hypothetical protein